MPHILDSFLVELGYVERPQEEQTLTRFLEKGRTSAEFQVSSLASSVLKFQEFAVGGFAAIGLGALSVAKHAADADQQFRLLGERTFQTTENARKFAAIQEILGADLNQIAFDPELLEREKKLSATMDQINQGLGGKYEDRLKQVRDVDTQLSLLKYEFLTLVPDAVSKSLNAVFGGSQSLTERLTGLTDYIAKNFSHVSDDIAKYLTPVLQDTKKVIVGMVPPLKEVASAFLGLIGTLAGDDSLRDGALNFENIGKAAQDATHIVAGFASSVSNAITVALQLASAVVDLGRAGYDLAHLDFKDVGKDLDAFKGQLGKIGSTLTHGGGAVLGGIGGSGLGAALGGVAGTMVAPGVGTYVGATLGSGIGTLGGGLLGSLFGHSNSDESIAAPKSKGVLTPAQAAKTLGSLKSQNIDLDGAAKRAGIDPDFLKAIVLTESGGRVNTPDSSTGAIGLGQVEPYNAHGLNLRDPNQNLDASAKLLRHALDTFGGDMSAAAAAYNGGEGRTHGVIAGTTHFKPQTLDYVPKVLANLDAVRQAANVQQTVQITVNAPNADAKQVASATMDALKRKQNMQLLASMADAQGVYSY